MRNMGQVKHGDTQHMKTKTTKPVRVRLVSCANRLREWAQLTGQSENKIAEFFTTAGIELADMADSNPERDNVRLAVRRGLCAMCEAAKLRKQSAELARRAARIVRESKGGAK